MKKLKILFFLLFLVSLSNAQTTIQFSGITWEVRAGGGGPGPNFWSTSPNNVWVDTLGLLHMKIRKIGNTWYCSEIIAPKSFGYGEYRFYVSSNVEKYDPEVVVGLFTYETDTREIDIEFSRWGDPSGLAGWYTVQPVVAGNQQSFALNLKGENSTHKFTWGSNSIFYQSYYGHAPALPSADSLIKEWNYAGNYNPPVGNERLHINFWLMGGQPPASLQEAELVIKAVYVPVPEAIADAEHSVGMIITPNPFSDSFTVIIPEKAENGTLLISDPTGKVICRQALTETKTEINLSNYPSGIYLTELFLYGEMITRKIIKK